MVDSVTAVGFVFIGMTQRKSLPVVLCGVLLLYVTQCESYKDDLRQSSLQTTGLKSTVDKFKVDFHHSLLSSKIRKKRESGLLGDLTDENAFVEEHIRVGSSVPEDLDYLSEYNLTFWTSVRHQGKNGVLVGTTNGDLVLFELHNSIATVVARSTDEAIGYKAKAFSHSDELWFTILQSLPNPCITLFKRVGRGIERRQTIVLEGESDFDLVTVRGVHYLAVATYKVRTSQGYTYQAHVDLYHWTRTQFDVIATRTTYGARSLACWVLDGSLYLSVAQEINDDKNLYIGSPVFFYNAKEENNLVLVETLNTKAPRKCAHFFVSGSHYLIFTGQFDGVIYWWSGNQFLEWQTVIGSAGGVDVSVISLSKDEVIIVVALEAEILFFTLDAAGYYTETFRMEMTGYSISSLQFMWDSQNYFALALQESRKPSPHSTWRLLLETYRLPKEGAMDPLLRCLYRMQSRLEEREAEIEHFNSRVDKVWLKDKEQNIPGRVIIKGSVTAEGHPVELGVVKITSTETEILPWTPSNIDEEIGGLNIFGNDVASKLRNSLRKSSDQTINGMKHFVGSVETPSFSLVEYKPDFLLNGIPISKYLVNTMKTSGDQNFLGSLNVKELSVTTAEALSIRNLSTTDFLLLKGEQLVKGSLYFSDVSATDIEAGPSGVLNSVEVYKLITTNTDQEITGLKSFSLLSSEVIDVRGYTNGEALDEIQKKVIDVHRGGEISGNLEFETPVIVQGNLFYSGLINNAVNISHLVRKGVNKHSDQEITGSKTFLSNVHVNGDLNIEGYINGVDISKDLITLSTDQDISGHLTFASPLTFEKNLLVDLVNDQDLDVSSVLRREQQFIEGHITFDSRLISDEIKMTGLKTLDYVDPSELEKTLVQQDHGAVKEAVVITNAVVRGNLIIDEKINELPIKDLPYIAYLKSKPQEISVPVLFPGSITAQDLEVDLLNDLDLDSDVVHTIGDEMILAQKVFQDGVNFKNFDTGRGILLGGIDITSLRNITDLPDETIVHGVKILDSLEVKGSLTAGSVNGLDLSKDLMLINEPQYIPGTKKFESAVVSELLAANVSPEIVNGQNFTEFISNAVLRTPQSSREIRNKTFTELKASDLRILDNSRIDGVFIPEMLLRAVTLNTSQYITGDKTFTGSLQFKSSFSAARVNDLDLVSHIHKIVFLDKEEVIRGRKTFHGDLHASDIVVHGLVNGVNLTLLFGDAVYKSKRNEISAPMVFATDLYIGSLIVKKPAQIDGISVDDLVFVNKESFFDYIELRTNLSIYGNLNVNGLVNDCDLNTVLKEALKLDGTEQILTGVTEFNSLNVTGSVTFRDTVSDIEITDLFKVVTRSDNHILHGNFHFGSGIAVRTLRLKGLIQGVDLGFIISDAVRKSKSQVIKGQKVFDDDLEIGILDGSDGLFVTETVNRVDMKELLSEVVWRDGHQVIHGEKIFNSFYANNVTALGYLNGLKVPGDVVLTFTSDTVFGPVHVMKDLVIESHLTVNGKVDGVDLKSFMDRRVTLEADEELTAEMIFKNVLIKGKMVVDGMINDIIPEMVVMSNKENKVVGIKTFNADLDVDGSVKIAFINGYNLTELLSSLLRLDNSERLQGLQIFTQPIHLNLAIISSINGITLERLEDTFKNTSSSIIGIENFLDSENKLQRDRIAMQMEAALYQISDLAYFIKVQELHIGSSSKLLIGHRIRSTGNLFYQTMVLWTTRTTCATPLKCCDSVYSYWLEADDEGFLTAVKEPEEGRYFPVRGPNLFPTDGNFVIWTNATSKQPTWCHSRMHETTIIGNLENAFEIFLTLNNSPLLTDLKAFREGNLYIVASYYTDKRSGDYSRSVVYVYNDMFRQWKEHQLLPAYGVLAMDITSYRTDSNILLALGTGLGSFPKSELLLYSWNDTARMFLETQRRPSDYVTTVLWVDHKNRKLLVVSSVAYWPDSSDCSKEISGGRIEVYEYYASLKWIQSIPLNGVVSMISFQIAGETYVAAASRQLETVYLLKWKGFGGFSTVQAIYSPGVRHLNTYRRQNEIFLTVSSASGSSSVLKAIIRGKTYYQRSEEEFPVELKDSPDLQSSQSSC